MHRLPVLRDAQTPSDRAEFFGRGALLDAKKRELYNTFLRRKVLAMFRAMSERAVQDAFDYAMLLDADTAINASNVDRFVAAIPGGGSAQVYTGRCLQEEVHSTDDAARRAAAEMRRSDVARFISLNKMLDHSARWPLSIPPSPGGGPGLIFSRKLLTSVHAQLSTCEPFTGSGAFGDSVYSGGDSMLTRCLATLGVRCSNERDLRVQAVCPFQHGCSLTSLFRKNPPWFYQAARKSTSHMAIARQAQPDSVLGLSSPVEETIAFHHVKPSSRQHDLGPDRRCAVRLRTDPYSRAGWWGSTCMPHFCFAGAARAGLGLLHRTVLAHPEVVPPFRRSLQFFSTAGRVQALLAELNWTAGSASGKTPEAVASSSITMTRLVRLYANNFPTIDPRDFKLTGEASAVYLYMPAASAFFAHGNFARTRLVIALRQPTARSLAELVGRSSAHPTTVSSQTTTATFLAALGRALGRCGPSALYAHVCLSCPRDAATRGGRPGAPRTSPGPDSCALSPVDTAERDVDARALWRSWYHLFLPPWFAIGRRLLVLYTDELRQQHATTGLAKLSDFLQLKPARLDARQLIAADADLPETASALEVARRFNTTELTVVTVRALNAHSVQRTDELMRQAHRAGVPDTWRPRGGTV